MIRILCIPPTIINGLFDFITVIESLYPYDKGGIGIVANECVREMKTPETQSMDIMHVNDSEDIHHGCFTKDVTCHLLISLTSFCRNTLYKLFNSSSLDMILSVYNECNYE